MDWDESPETHENYRQSERLELYQKYIDQLLAEGKAYKSYVTEEELAAERERQEAAGETPRYINEYLGMSEEEKATYISEREAAGIIPTVRLAVNESGIYKWHDMVVGVVTKKPQCSYIATKKRGCKDRWKTLDIVYTVSRRGGSVRIRR